MNVFRKLAQSIDRDNRRVAAETLYYESLNELRYRQSRSGRAFHDEASIRSQWEAALQLHQEIKIEFGIDLPLPES